ncbi:unnamed protein product [Lasius platythorax]|uniref:Uncharacterized protein n=1 Tax=Lasius platythorax TaxID=488582 RepID=A0AAV2P2Q9_9HYME
MPATQHQMLLCESLVDPVRFTFPDVKKVGVCDNSPQEREREDNKTTAANSCRFETLHNKVYRAVLDIVALASSAMSSLRRAFACG